MSDALLTQILTSLRIRYAALNTHYEAGWTDSWSHRRCEHAHHSLIDAAKCAMPHSAGWYVFAVDIDGPCELTDEEDRVVNRYRFGLKAVNAQILH